LAELKRWDEFRKLTTDNTFIEATKKYLDSQDSSHAAGRAAKLGLCFVEAKDRENARLWLDYGVTKDPNNPISDNSVERWKDETDREGRNNAAQGTPETIAWSSTPAPHPFSANIFH